MAPLLLDAESQRDLDHAAGYMYKDLPDSDPDDDPVETLLGLVQTRSSLRVEWYIVLLIVAELLLTFGLAFAIEEIVSMIWGKSPVDYRIPAALDFPAFTVFSTNYPAYKIFMLLISVAVLVITWLFSDWLRSAESSRLATPRN